MKDKVQFFKALADETRLRIMALLLSEGELCVCDLIAAVRLPQSTVSRHLALLRKTGLVNDRRCGVWVYYSVSEEMKARQELVSFLERELTGTGAATADRELLAGLGRGGRCP